MRFWTAHLRSGRPPVLVREGFSWGALVFGPLWFASQCAWIPAVLALAASVLIAALAPPAAATVLLIGLAWLFGLVGRDLCRWSLDRRGYVLAQVVAARDFETALERLLARRPDLVGSFLAPGAP
jgi:hypothetical protein